MSHITTVVLQINDLDALEAAAEELDLELVRNARDYKWYGRNNAKCEHKLRVRNAGQQTYEIGLAREGDGYKLMFDAHMGGYGLMEKVSATGSRNGKDIDRLRQAYATAVTERTLRADGYRVQRVNVNGKVELTATRTAGLAVMRR